MIKNLFTIALLIGFAYAMHRIGVDLSQRPGRPHCTWSSPDGRVRIEERIIDDGGATVGFYKNLYVVRGDEWERIASIRLVPKKPLVWWCAWRGNDACEITIDPAAYRSWSEGFHEEGRFVGVQFSFATPPLRAAQPSP